MCNTSIKANGVLCWCLDFHCLDKIIIIRLGCSPFRCSNHFQPFIKSFLSPLSQVNLFFLLNIVRVLVTKLRDTHRAESNMYMKAVRATLILVPLLGIQFVLFPYKPQGRFALEIYDYIMNILMHYQVGQP